MSKLEVVRGITVEWGLVGGEVVAVVVVMVPSRRSRSSVVVKDVMVVSIFIFVFSWSWFSGGCLFRSKVQVIWYAR